METKTTSTGSMTEYIFTGTNLEVKDAIDATMARFDPRGYNTRVARVDILGPDQLRAVVTRWNSCD